MIHEAHDGRRQRGRHQSQLYERVELADERGLQPGRGERRVKVARQGHLRQGHLGSNTEEGCL